METQKQATSTYEYVQKRPLSNSPKEFKELPKEEQTAWINYFCSWTWRAVECLADLKDFKPTITSIAKRLNISIEDTVAAVEGLEALKILRRGPEGVLYRYIKDIDPVKMGVPLNEILKSHLLISNEVNRRIPDHEHMRVSTFFLSTNRNRIKEILDKVNELLIETRENYAGELDEVFALSLSAASLTKRSPRYERGNV